MKACKSKFIRFFNGKYDRLPTQEELDKFEGLMEGLSEGDNES